MGAKWWRVTAINRFLIRFAFSYYTWFLGPILAVILSRSAANEFSVVPAILSFSIIGLFFIICLLRPALTSVLIRHHKQLEDTERFQNLVLVSDEPYRAMVA